METKGYYNGVVYEHIPTSEKMLFTSSLTDLVNSITKKEFCEEVKGEKKDISVKGIEIGVLNGETSAHLLGISEAIHLIGIDPLIPDSMEASLIGSKVEIDKNVSKFANRWQFIQSYSNLISNIFVDGSLDFIFIDGDHTYESVKKDYELYAPKIKSGGLIFFHDSRMNRGGANFHVGSSKFVDEVISNDRSIELIGEAFSLTCFKKV